MQPCTWCGGTDHPPYQHGALHTKPNWEQERYPFWEPRVALIDTFITLTPEWIAAAEKRARKIVADDTKFGWGMQFPPVGGDTNLSVAIRGAGAEVAGHLATGLELHWEYLTREYRRRPKPHDLGKRTEVRSVKKANGYLYATDRDPKERVFLMVTGEMPTYNVRGWIEGEELIVPGRFVKKNPPKVPYGGFRAVVSDLNPLPLPPDA